MSSGALAPCLERLVLRRWNVDAVASLTSALAAVQVDLRECRVARCSVCAVLLSGS